LGGEVRIKREGREVGRGGSHKERRERLGGEVHIKRERRREQREMVII
jgi:hypothetical protein